MVASTDVLGTSVEAIVVRMGDMMDKLRFDFSTVIWDGPRVTCDEFIHLVVTDFTDASVYASADPDAGSAPASGAVHLRDTTIMDLDVVLSGSVSLHTKATDANAI